ncbi:MAG: TIGR03905 family TSCPD domain-containing protein [Oscillospiraceae bacterium]
MKYSYRPKGVCSQLMEFELVDGIIHNYTVIGGCSGNLQGIGRLVEGMSATEAIARLRGIRCGFKQTSCPDQFSLGLEKALGEQ